jgi:hypothetical protein
MYFSELGNISKIIKFYTDHEFGLRFGIFQLLGNDVNQTNYVKLQIGMIINGLNSTRILIVLVLVLLQNSLLYCPRAKHSFSKETCSVKALLIGQSKISYYKVLLYDHSIYSYVFSRLKTPHIFWRPWHHFLSPPTPFLQNFIEIGYCKAS